MTVGLGAGSKYIHSLLDGNKDIYAIPGYPLMYFYPHYDELSREISVNHANLKLFLEHLLRRIPSVYDTTIMPGSETLDELRDEKGKPIRVELDKFTEEAVNFCKNQVITSKNILLAIHKAHAKLFAKQLDAKNIKRFLIHIHDDHMLPRMKKDFPEMVILTTHRKPSFNLERRIKSSYLEANNTKVSEIDYELLRWMGPEKVAYFHSMCFQTYSKLKTNMVIIDYSYFLFDEYKAYEKLCQALDIQPAAKNKLIKSFLGHAHKPSFYEKNRKLKIDEIRYMAAKESHAKYSAMDNIYFNILNQKQTKYIDLFKAVLSAFVLNKLEKSLIIDIISLKIYAPLANDLKLDCAKSKRYNFYHGFFRFKWSTPRRLLHQIDYLKKIRSKYKFWGDICLKSAYITVFAAAPLIIISSIAKRIFYQLDLISKANFLARAKGRKVYFIHRRDA